MLKEEKLLPYLVRPAEAKEQVEHLAHNPHGRSTSVTVTSPSKKQSSQVRAPPMPHPISLKNVPTYNAADIMQLSSEDLANELAVLGETTSTVRLKAGTLRYSRIVGSEGAMHVSRTIDSKYEHSAVASREGDGSSTASRVDSTLQKNGASILLVENSG